MIIDLTDNIDYITKDRGTFLYHTRIIITNIKRWEKLRQKKTIFP